jgi:hypothetical protein
VRTVALVPSRGRPDNIRRLATAIADTAAHPVVLWVALDDDDPTRHRYPLDLPVEVRYTVGPRRRLAATWNTMGAVIAAGRDDADGFTHVALWGDDVTPETPGWDELLAEPLPDLGYACSVGWSYGRDGIWDDRPHPDHPHHLVLPTHTLTTPETLHRVGYVAPPGLVHLNIDLAWQALGLPHTPGDVELLHYVPDVTVLHRHRMHHDAKIRSRSDQTYRDANDNAAQVHADHQAYNTWRASPDFTATYTRLRTGH